MGKINSLAELTKRKEELSLAEKQKYLVSGPGGKILVRVHMGTSGLASGAKEIYEFMSAELEKRNIDADVVSTGDKGYCFAEPTLEVLKPGQEPVVFGFVDKLKADEIIQKYIRSGELVEGILPVNYREI